MQPTNCKHCGLAGKLRQQGRGFEILLSYVCDDCFAMYVAGIWQAPKPKAKSYACNICGEELTETNAPYYYTGGDLMCCSCSETRKARRKAKTCNICGAEADGSGAGKDWCWSCFTSKEHGPECHDCGYLKKRCKCFERYPHQHWLKDRWTKSD